MTLFLKTLLEPLRPFLSLKNLQEISVLKEKELALEIEGKGYEFVHADVLDAAYWTQVCYTLANMNGLTWDPETHPILSTRLPDLETQRVHRFEAMMGPFVENGISISIRIKRETSHTLEDFGLSGEVKDHVISRITEGSSIIISGGTSSGKTTLLNLLLQHIPRHKRILTIEDTRELDLPHRNSKAYTVPRHEMGACVSYQSIIDHFMRSRPDMIITGELSISNSAPILRLLNTGHKGFMCTVHANSPVLALEEAFTQNLRLGGHSVIDVVPFLKKTIDLVIQVDHQGQKNRRITALWAPQTDTYTQIFSENLEEDSEEKSSARLESNSEEFLEEMLSLKGNMGF